MLAAFFSIFIFCSSAHAEKLIASVIDIPPLSFVEGSEKKGFYVEILQALTKDAGFEIEFYLVPYLRAISMVESKSVDLTIMFDTDISEKIKSKKLPLFERTLNVYSLKKNLIGDIGRLNGGCTDLEKNKQVNLVNINTLDQGLELLIKNRLSGVCGTNTTILYSIKKLDIKSDTITKTRIIKKMFSAHFHPDFKDEKIERLKKALQKINTNGTLQKIRKKYNDIEDI